MKITSESIIVVLLILLLLAIPAIYFPNDQPMRYAAVLLFAPYIFWKGMHYDDIYLMAFGVGLFAWDLYCILFRKTVA